MVSNYRIQERRITWKMENVVVVDAVGESNCYNYINENGTHISVCDCKNGGIGEVNCS